jgi:hypothetical protein
MEITTICPICRARRADEHAEWCQFFGSNIERVYVEQPRRVSLWTQILRWLEDRPSDADRYGLDDYGGLK